MNFLAHIYLSFDDDEVSIGNFIADSIRGNRYTHFPETIQKGILLHRAIDTYTDAHPVHKKSSKRLHINQGHYSRVVIDVYYDHFLAKNWLKYSEEPLETFVERFYALLSEYYELLPEPTKKMMPYMIGDNWLLNYAHIKGIDKVLKGLYRRTGKRSNMDKAVLDLQKHYDLFESEFHSFFKDLVIFSHQKYKDL
ncbi:acyl carrier protein phosphodiesterase [uncultured Muriicola sp.]|uniref:acyl carrier protein phosphodiesterase n=1 Tax=uncultured Muriicola sp. TaxID=1583102 RepID=UPI002626F008|nr:acyl carrier protein phosphodiesterase [uncultured Muriicola sp.]